MDESNKMLDLFDKVLRKEIKNIIADIDDGKLQGECDFELNE